MGVRYFFGVGLVLVLFWAFAGIWYVCTTKESIFPLFHSKNDINITITIGEEKPKDDTENPALS